MIADVAFLINPTAARGRGLRVGVAAAGELRGTGVSVRELVGAGPRQAVAMARYPGKHVLRPDLLTFRCSTVTLSAPDVAAYGDGEFIAALPVTCSVVPDAVQVLVPR